MGSKLFSLIILFVLIVNITAKATNDNKTVSITVSGSGKTLDDAKQNALRSAIEQAFGTFISAKTEIFNDQVVADQMASVSSGNIQSYSMLNESQFPDGSWGVTLNAIVSVDKLVSFVEAKGIAIEIKGGTFALNIKQQLLNEQAEINAISEMIGILHEPMQTSFDYEIESKDPKSLDAESKNWEIPLIVTATSNKNMDFCANYFEKTLASISLSKSEVENYKLLNKEIFSVTFNYKGNDQTFYLRKKTSLNALLTMALIWDFYVGGFWIQEGKNTYTLIKGKLHKFSNFSIEQNEIKNNHISFSFLTAGMVAGTYNHNDQLTLEQIEQMTGYRIEPAGVRSQFKHGGFVIVEAEGEGHVLAVPTLGYLSQDEARLSCEELVLNGYDDWRLPNINALKAIDDLGLLDLSQIFYNGNWSSNKNDEGRGYFYYFKNKEYSADGRYSTDIPSRTNLVWAIRSF